MDSLVVQTAIGLVFVFATFAALTSVVTESVTRFIGLRGEYLLRGIRSLVDGRSEFKLSLADILRKSPASPVPKDDEPEEPVVTKLMENPLISGSAGKADMPADAGNAKLTNKQRRQLPSYLSGRAFAQALIDTVIPDLTGDTTIGTVRNKLGDPIAGVPDKLRHALDVLATDADDSITKFRINVEKWYDDHMARVSGWYKRHVRWISLAIGAIAVIVFNLNVFSIGQALYTDQGLREATVTQATQASTCATKDPATCLRDLRNELDTTQSAGLPIGWRTQPECAPGECNWGERVGLWQHAKSAGHNVVFALIVIVGWALMVIALLPGARFWFDLLGRLGSLRSTGPKPATTS